MILHTYTMTDASFTKEINKAKELLFQTLYSEGIVSQDPEILSAHYSIIVKELGFFGKIWDKLMGHTEGTHIVILKNPGVPLSEDKLKINFETSI